MQSESSDTTSDDELLRNEAKKKMKKKMLVKARVKSKNFSRSRFEKLKETVHKVPSIKIKPEVITKTSSASNLERCQSSKSFAGSAPTSRVIFELINISQVQRAALSLLLFQEAVRGHLMWW